MVSCCNKWPKYYGSKYHGYLTGMLGEEIPGRLPGRSSISGGEMGGVSQKEKAAQVKGWQWEGVSLSGGYVVCGWGKRKDSEDTSRDELIPAGLTTAHSWKGFLCYHSASLEGLQKKALSGLGAITAGLQQQLMKSPTIHCLPRLSLDTHHWEWGHIDFPWERTMSIAGAHGSHSSGQDAALQGTGAGQVLCLKHWS